jgi:hypothetical protein
MPPNYEMIDRAILDINSGVEASQQATALAFNVPRSTLQDMGDENHAMLMNTSNG